MSYITSDLVVLEIEAWWRAEITVQAWERARVLAEADTGRLQFLARIDGSEEDPRVNDVTIGCGAWVCQKLLLDPTIRTDRSLALLIALNGLSAFGQSPLMDRGPMVATLGGLCVDMLMTSSKQSRIHHTLVVLDGMSQLPKLDVFGVGVLNAIIRGLQGLLATGVFRDRTYRHVENADAIAQAHRRYAEASELQLAALAWLALSPDCSIPRPKVDS